MENSMVQLDELNTCMLDSTGEQFVNLSKQLSDLGVNKGKIAFDMASAKAEEYECEKTDDLEDIEVRRIDAKIDAVRMAGRDQQTSFTKQANDASAKALEAEEAFTDEVNNKINELKTSIRSEQYAETLQEINSIRSAALLAAKIKKASQLKAIKAQKRPQIKALRQLESAKLKEVKATATKLRKRINTTTLTGSQQLARSRKLPDAPTGYFYNTSKNGTLYIQRSKGSNKPVLEIEGKNLVWASKTKQIQALGLPATPPTGYTYVMTTKGNIYIRRLPIKDVNGNAVVLPEKKIVGNKIVDVKEK